MTREEIAAVIDHTLLRPAATRADVERHCLEAIERRFRGVCLYPAHLKAAAGILTGTGIVLSGAVAFPHGASTLLGKVFEALEASRLGATELDIVLDLAAIAEGDRSRIDEEVRTLIDRVKECRLKLIVETGIFDRERLEPVLGVMNQRRPAFVKTSTGVNARGASVEDVAFLRSALHRSIGIKAAGGIRTPEQVEALVAAGADVIGTSAGAEILDRVPP